MEGAEFFKAALETTEEGTGELVALPSGVSYVDKKVGVGSASLNTRDFVGFNLTISADGEELLDSKKEGKPFAIVYGKKPYDNINNEGCVN